MFGDYVSIYNFRDSISDGATVPLYYENRIPELQLTNDDFDDELEDLLEAAELDEVEEKAVARRFSQQYQLITRPRRLTEIAADLVHHFVNRGFRGKAMYVAIDKATAVRMYDLVKTEWARYLAELEGRVGEQARVGAAAFGVAYRVHAQHRHGCGGVAGPERGGRHGCCRARHCQAPQADYGLRTSTPSSRTPTTRSDWCSCAPCG